MSDRAKHLWVVFIALLSAFVLALIADYLMRQESDVFEEYLTPSGAAHWANQLGGWHRIPSVLRSQDALGESLGVNGNTVAAWNLKG